MYFKNDVARHVSWTLLAAAQSTVDRHIRHVAYISFQYGIVSDVAVNAWTRGGVWLHLEIAPSRVHWPLLLASPPHTTGPRLSTQSTAISSRLKHRTAKSLQSSNSSSIETFVFLFSFFPAFSLPPPSSSSSLHSNNFTNASFHPNHTRPSVAVAHHGHPGRVPRRKHPHHHAYTRVLACGHAAAADKCRTLGGRGYVPHDVDAIHDPRGYAE